MLENVPATYPQPEYQNIENAQAYVHKNIPISPALQMELFQQVFPELKTPTFDYINLATNEFEQDPESPEAMRAIEYRFLQARSLFTRVRMRLLGLNPHDKERFDKFVESSQDLIKRANESRFYVHYEHPDRQLGDFRKDESGVLQRRDTDIFNKFREIIKTNPEKPFLIISGHGGQKWSFKKGLPTKKWRIGETDPDKKIDLEKLFSHLNLEKYSAVLLVSCNEGKAQPPRINNVPLFYVEGEANRLKANTPKVIE